MNVTGALFSTVGVSLSVLTDRAKPEQCSLINGRTLKIVKASVLRQQIARLSILYKRENLINSIRTELFQSVFLHVLDDPSLKCRVSSPHVTITFSLFRLYFYWQYVMAERPLNLHTKSRQVSTLSLIYN